MRVRQAMHWTKCLSMLHIKLKASMCAHRMHRLSWLTLWTFITLLWKIGCENWNCLISQWIIYFFDRKFDFSFSLKKCFYWKLKLISLSYLMSFLFRWIFFSTNQGFSRKVSPSKNFSTKFFFGQNIIYIYRPKNSIEGICNYEVCMSYASWCHC